ncbi:MAG: hypothetical protein AAFX95_12800 [Cyanobacteria bacterium J06639_16]
MLQCVSELGWGTEFSIKLPIKHLKSLASGSDMTLMVALENPQA